jgi:hypothetical protein
MRSIPTPRDAVEKSELPSGDVRQAPLKTRRQGRYAEHGHARSPRPTRRARQLHARPVRNVEAGDASEFPLVVRDERELPCDGLCRDQRIERSYECPCSLELRADLRVRRGIARDELEDGQRPGKVVDEAAGPGCRCTLDSARAQLCLGDDADGGVRTAVGKQSLQDGAVLLERVDTHVRVEQELHRRAARLSTLPCGGREKSSGTPVNDSM